jgi:hypothetical protein
MTRTLPAPFWVLLVLGTPQAALAASVLCEWGWVWGVAAVGYVAGLVGLARLPRVTAGPLIALGYLGPLLGYAAVYTALTLPGRPETAEARVLFRSPAAGPPPPTSSDVPTPRLLPRGNWAVARGVWLVLSTALYLAACALAGLFWHTPVVVYLAAAVAAVLAFRRPEGFP